MHIFTDGLTKVTISNNNIRIVLVRNGPDNERIDAGTLVIPVNMAAGFAKQLTRSLETLDEQIKEQQDARAEAAAEARREAEANQRRGDLH